MENIVNFKDVEKALLEIRGQRVLLDKDVAKLYGVNTMRVNEAVKNNPDKFPTGYIIELTKDEKNEVIENFDNPKLKFSPVLPKAFTEKGLYMLATILKSPKATQTTIAIIETFAAKSQNHMTSKSRKDSSNTEATSFLTCSIKRFLSAAQRLL